MTLVSARTKFKIRKYKRGIKDIPDKIQYWILKNIFNSDVIEEFAIDTDLLHDYYNEPRDY